MQTFRLNLHFAISLLVLPVCLSLLGGCASFHASVDPGRNLGDVQRFFVVSNLNDNHAIDEQIAAGLKARGRTAGTGPLTMMPDDNQAIVTYQDHWTWDFSDHLVYLTIDIRDPRTNQAYASATFSAKVPLRDPVPTIVDRLVGDLLARRAPAANVN